MEITTLYEDQNTLVINKPVGLVVNRASSVKVATVQDWVEDRQEARSRPFEDKEFVGRSGICHRLDKETSGCLVIAKSPEALRYYLRLFKGRRVKKEYLALVHGQVEPREGAVVLPLKRSHFERDKWQVHYEGKRAETEWTVLGRYRCEYSNHWNNKLTYLRLNLKTGRTHQIRVHLAFLGWPVFADDKYLNSEVAGKDRRALSHHFLHAEKVSLVVFGGAKVEITAPLPGDSEKLLKDLVVD